jgi:hypothetical protein
MQSLFSPGHTDVKQSVDVVGVCMVLIHEFGGQIHEEDDVICLAALCSVDRK